MKYKFTVFIQELKKDVSVELDQCNYMDAVKKAFEDMGFEPSKINVTYKSNRGVLTFFYSVLTEDRFYHCAVYL